MNYETKTNYSKSTLVDFKRFTLTKKSIIKPALLYIFCVVIIVCSFIYNRKFELNFTTIVYPLIAIIGSIIVTFIYYIRPAIGRDKIENTVVTYTFTDDAIVSGDKSFLYNELFAVYEDKRYFYFYINESDGFLIEKSNIDFDLAGLLEEKVDKKKKLKLLKK